MRSVVVFYCRLTRNMKFSKGYVTITTIWVAVLSISKIFSYTCLCFFGLLNRFLSKNGFKIPPNLFELYNGQLHLSHKKKWQILYQICRRVTDCLLTESIISTYWYYWLNMVEAAGVEPVVHYDFYNVFRNITSYRTTCEQHFKFFILSLAYKFNRYFPQKIDFPLN